jgi:hypothetical protein
MEWPPWLLRRSVQQAATTSQAMNLQLLPEVQRVRRRAARGVGPWAVKKLTAGGGGCRWTCKTQKGKYLGLVYRITHRVSDGSVLPAAGIEAIDFRE